MNAYMKQQLSQYQEINNDKARLLVSCPDQPGIVAAVSSFLFENGANIIESSQYTTDPEGGRFFLRIEFEAEGIREKIEQMKATFAAVAESFRMTWSMNLASELKRVAIFVSKELHCLNELLWEWQSGNLMAEIAAVISNHEDARETVESLNIPFLYMKANKDIRQEVEKQQLEWLEEL
ncbi:ACT domain-containing protein, partial [Bacillus haynesii]|uniref:ACT domain-containing protein n=1 Tax=Bacillus haynesii TaxID=1925021 RepID=UPI002280B1B5